MCWGNGGPSYLTYCLVHGAQKVTLEWESEHPRDRETVTAEGLVRRAVLPAVSSRVFGSRPTSDESQWDTVRN